MTRRKATRSDREIRRGFHWKEGEGSAVDLPSLDRPDEDGDEEDIGADKS
jgi:hypothetical protein